MKRLQPITMSIALVGCALQPTTLAASTTASETTASETTASESTATVERRPVVMGTMARIQVTGPTRAEALATTGTIEQILRSAEGELSTWRDGTELGRFNRAPLDQRIELSSDLDDELSRALDCATATGGAFDPTVGALTKAWDLRGRGRQPREQELLDARRNSGWRFLTRESGRWQRHRDIVVDEGGFGKGAALDRVGRRLAALSDRRVLIDLGGQLLFFDSRADRQPWRIDVADPDERSRPVLRLSLPHGSVATSANSERAVGTANAEIGHLLDPRTGSPAFDFGSMTVWAATALEADCLATGLFVAGPDAALDHAEQHPIEVLVIERHGSNLEARASAGFQDRIEVISNRIALITP